MNLGSLAKRYARAVRDLAREANAVEATGVELARVAATFADPGLAAVLSNQAIDSQARRKLAADVVVSLGVSRTVTNLVRLLADGDRLEITGDLSRSYDDLVNTELGRVRAGVHSATPLDPAVQQELSALVQGLTGKREVVVSTEVDPGLLGGVVLKVGGKVYDGSVKNQLERLGAQMAKGGA